MSRSENRLLALLHLRSREGQPLSTRVSYAASDIKIAGSTQLSYPVVETSIYGRTTGELISHTFSLTGALGALPYAYSELLAQRHKEKEFALQAFLNLFNHRAVSLLYEGWLSQMWMNTASTVEELTLSKPRAALLAYAGILPTADTQKRPAPLWGHLLNHAGVFSRRTRTASGLVSVLKNQFGLSVELEQFVGKWFEISHNARYRLMRDRNSFQLGMNTSLGRTTLHPQAFFRIHLSVKDAAQYLHLAPGSPQIQLMQQLIRSYAGEELQFQIVIHVAGPLVPCTPLTGQQGTGIRIGWNSLVGRANTTKTYQTSIFRDYSRS